MIITVTRSNSIDLCYNIHKSFKKIIKNNCKEDTMKPKMIIVLIGLTALLSSSLEATQRPFITTWKTDNPGVSADNEIKIGTNPESGTYNYNIDCDGDGTNEEINVTGDYTCHYDTAGTYTVKISGDFPQI